MQWPSLTPFNLFHSGECHTRICMFCIDLHALVERANIRSMNSTGRSKFCTGTSNFSNIKHTALTSTECTENFSGQSKWTMTILYTPSHTFSTNRWATMATKFFFIPKLSWNQASHGVEASETFLNYYWCTMTRKKMPPFLPGFHGHYC